MAALASNEDDASVVLLAVVVEVDVEAD